jgi:AraC-like DNA-binding protein
MRDELKLSSAIATPVFEVLASLGADVREGLARSRDASMIRGSLADEVMAAAALRTGDEALGITVARRIPLGGLGLVDHALCTSATLGEGLARLSKHYGVATERVRMTLELVPPDAAIWLVRRPESPPDRHWIEFSLATIAIRLRECVSPDLALSRVALTHAAPRDRRAQDSFFGVRVEYGAARDEIVFAAHHLHTPLRTRMACLSEVLDARLAAMAAPVRDDEYAARVRRIVMKRIDEGGAIRLGTVASELGVSARTVQRELQHRRTSLVAIADDVRKGLALHALSSNKESIAAVARRLGFAEPSALFRAVRRWTGESPSALRSRSQSANA